MDKDWAEKNKEIQKLLSNEKTYKEAIQKLIEFRAEMLGEIAVIVNGFPNEAFSRRPFANTDGYHSKTLAYSIWHIFRIEDIVAHELIASDEQVLFAQGFLTKTKSPIITTGNELKNDEIEEFSKSLDVNELYLYSKAVMESSNEILQKLEYRDLKRKFYDSDKEKLSQTGCVSTDEEAVWLIDYWCGKDVRGLIKMPFSRHWIMHIEAMRRIKNKL